MKKLLIGLFALTLLSGCFSGEDKKEAKLPIVENTAKIEVHGDYEFFIPKTEAELKSETHYGRMIVSTTPDFDDSYFAKNGIEVRNSYEFKGNKYFFVSVEANELDALNKLNKTQGVRYAEADVKYQLDGTIYPDDTLYPQQYSAKVTGLDRAYEEFGFGPYAGKEVYVAVLDSGINIPHEDLEGVIYAGWSNFSKNEKNEYTYTEGELVNMFDPEYNDPNNKEKLNWDANGDEGHGTHVSGTIAAEGENGLGVAGVCWDVNLIMYKVFADNDYDDPKLKDVDGSGGTETIYGSLKHLVDWKKDKKITSTIPVNMSLGGSWASHYALEMVNYALENNVVVITSAGNDGQFKESNYPTCYPGVITVGASDGNNERVSFSTATRHMSVLAPGKSIVSTGHINGDMTADGYNDFAEPDHYVTMSGTSMSAPFVTGLAGYVLTFAPEITPAGLRELLEDHADYNGESEDEYDYINGHGVVNAYETIKAVANGNYDNNPRYSRNRVRILVEAETLVPSKDADGNIVTDESGEYVMEVTTKPLEENGVYLYDENGRFVFSGETDENGYIAYNMLPIDEVTEGFYSRTYTAVTSVEGEVLQKTFTFPVVEELTDAEDNVVGEVIKNEDLDISITLASKLLLYVNTVKNESGNCDSTDSIIDIYDAEGNSLKHYDQNLLDTVQYGFTEPGTYYVKISRYADAFGEYGLMVGFDNVESVAGVATMVGEDDSYEPNDSFETATEIEVDGVYNLFLAAGDANDDYFKIELTPNLFGMEEGE